MHLISSFRYPVQSHLGPEDALNALLQAPRIVNEMSPMAWTYFNQAPSDGQLFLAWQPPRMQSRFATDGYIWADQESQFHQEIKGYVGIFEDLKTTQGYTDSIYRPSRFAYIVQVMQ